MTNRMEKNGLHVARELVDFTEQVLLPDSGIEPRDFWFGLAKIINDLAPQNKELLLKRDAIQAKIDAWHLERKGQEHDKSAYKSFLMEIGYLVPEGEAFQIETAGVDPEIASIAGAQLVVPVSNARFALNAANARWGSLYDALYGTDVIDEAKGKERSGGYNPVRGRLWLTMPQTCSMTRYHSRMAATPM